MSDYDPNRMDPQRPVVNEAGYAADRGFNWNWIIGGIAALVVLIMALSFMGRDDRTADTGLPPAATTGQSTPSAAPKPVPPTPSATPTERPAPPRPASPNQ